MSPDEQPPEHTDDDNPGERASVVVEIGSARRKRKKAKAPPACERMEIDTAAMLVERYGNVLRFCAALGGWFAWDGTRWALDVKGFAHECVKAIARELAREAAATLDAELFAHARRAGSAAGVSAVLELARTTPGIVVTPDELDADPWILNTSSGAVDLRTGTLRPHRREDLCTRVTGAAYDATATAPTWNRFLAEIQTDPEVRGYLARLFGYAAVGLVREHMICVLWGTGANGKSVLAECIMHVLGDYARPGPSSLIVASAGHEVHPTDVASCAGSRLVVVHETKRGAAFDASKIKLLTGGDRLTARHMREDFFTFAPSHTLVMLSNYKPQADASDSALWRRVQLVPFGVTIPTERQDRELGERIRATEAAGVLAWLVRGALEWQRIGLAPLAAVREQTEAYRAGEDSIAAFLEERCVRVDGHRQPAGALYAAFRAWCDASGVRPVRSNDFSAEITGRGFERDETSAGRFYRGIGLRAEGGERDAD